MSTRDYDVVIVAPSYDVAVGYCEVDLRRSSRDPKVLIVTRAERLRGTDLYVDQDVRWVGLWEFAPQRADEIEFALRHVMRRQRPTVTAEEDDGLLTKEAQ